LRQRRSVDLVLFGTFVTRVKIAPLAARDARGASFMVSYLDREEKGTDVNLATVLLMDVFNESVDAAVVISNDSDLALPIRIARCSVPVGVVNPGSRPLAGKLQGSVYEGARGHWWARLTKDDYRHHQMPAVVGEFRKPPDW
jgi:hypothetical protein